MTRPVSCDLGSELGLSIKYETNPEINMLLSRHYAAKIMPQLNEHLSYRAHLKKSLQV